MKLQKLPLYADMDAWTVPMIIPDNYEKLIFDKRDDVARRQAGYVHLRHRVSRAILSLFEWPVGRLLDQPERLFLLKTDILPDAIETTELAFAYLSRLVETPAVGNLGAVHLTSGLAVRCSKWETERHLLMYVLLSLYTQMLFVELYLATEEGDAAFSSCADRAIAFAQELAKWQRTATLPTLNDRPFLPDPDYYDTLVQVINTAKLYRLCYSRREYPQLSDKDWTDVLFSVTVKDAKTMNVVRDYARLCHDSYEFANECYAKMIHKTENKTALVTDTTYIPLLNFVMQCRIYFNLLRVIYSTRFYSFAEDCDDTKEQLFARRTVIAKLVASPSVRLYGAQERAKIMAEIVKKRGKQTAGSSEALKQRHAPFIKREFAEVDWSLAVFQVASLACIKRTDLQRAIACLTTTHEALGRTIEHTYHGHGLATQEIDYDMRQGKPVAAESAKVTKAASNKSIEPLGNFAEICRELLPVVIVQTK